MQTLFYQGAEPYYTSQRVYDVEEPVTYYMNSLPQHFWRSRFGRPEPFSCLITVEPTTTRLGKIGLKLARA